MNSTLTEARTAPMTTPMPRTAVELDVSAEPDPNGSDTLRRHLPVIAAAAATVCERDVRLRRVAIIAAAAVAAGAVGVPGRRHVVLLGRDGVSPWVSRGRIRVMTSRP